MKGKKKLEKKTTQQREQSVPSLGQTELCADHPQFVKLAKSVRKAVKNDQKLGLLFMVNPVLAMKEIDPELSDSMKARVKEVLGSSRLNEGKRKLFDKVKQGEVDIPWVQRVTFRKDKIADLIGG